MLAGVMVTACIALGSNLGNREENLRAAIGRINALPSTRVTAVSQFVQTDPVDAPADSPLFLNAATIVETSFSAEALMQALLDIERELGRSRINSPRNAPRPIDLDLLLFGDASIQTPSLTIPHPRMHERLFVLEPLSQIAPNLKHPTLHRTIRELFDCLQNKQMHKKSSKGTSS